MYFEYRLWLREVAVPSAWVDNNGSGCSVSTSRYKHCLATCIKIKDFDSSRHTVRPVEIVCHPIHCNILCEDKEGEYQQYTLVVQLECQIVELWKLLCDCAH